MKKIIKTIVLVCSVSLLTGCVIEESSDNYHSSHGYSSATTGYNRDYQDHGYSSTPSRKHRHRSHHHNGNRSQASQPAVQQGSDYSSTHQGNSNSYAGSENSSSNSGYGSSGSQATSQDQDGGYSSTKKPRADETSVQNDAGYTSSN